MHGYKEVVRPMGSESGSRRVRKEMPAQKSDIRRGILALGGEEGGQTNVRNRKLRTIDRFVERFPSGCCSVISYPGETGRIVGVEVAEYHLVSTVLQEGVKIRRQDDAWGI